VSGILPGGNLQLATGLQQHPWIRLPNGELDTKLKRVTRKQRKNVTNDERGMSQVVSKGSDEFKGLLEL